MTRLRLDEVAYRVLPQVAPGRALASSEWRTLRAAAEALLEDLPLAISADEVADNVERFLCIGRSKRAWRCRVLLTLLELIPLHTCWRRFSGLSVDERKALFAERVIGARGLWGVCAKVRYLVIMGAYGDERVHAQLGVWVPGPARPERARRSLPVRGPARNGRNGHSSQASRLVEHEDRGVRAQQPLHSAAT
jgi:hypothetical protein